MPTSISAYAYFTLLMPTWLPTDQNGDGTVDFKEFITRLAESLDIKTVKERTEWAFEIYDLDRDGNLVHP